MDMTEKITLEEAKDMFDVEEQRLYVCDGKKECSNPSCLDYSDMRACHHTADINHARYATHDAFESHPATCGERAVIVYVEQIRG